ncbi:hypothetical protein RZS08_41425, partial [Arthrospira platensis SPKY1]|nr:hypothetical protein [Arthrospira platensis SPKY1]
NYLPCVDQLVSKWLPSNWVESYTFEVYEIDAGPNADLKISANYNYKDSLKTTLLSGSIDMTFQDLFNSKDDYIGKSVLRYTDELQGTLLFSAISGLNFRIYYSDKNAP